MNTTTSARKARIARIRQMLAASIPYAMRLRLLKELEELTANR